MRIFGFVKRLRFVNGVGMAGMDAVDGNTLRFLPYTAMTEKDA